MMRQFRKHNKGDVRVKRVGVDVGWSSFVVVNLSSCAEGFLKGFALFFEPLVLV